MKAESTDKVLIKGNYATSMHKHLVKGRWVLVEGRLKQNKWKDEAGINHYAVVLKVENLRFAPGSFQAKDEQQPAGMPQFKPQSYDQAPVEDYGPPPEENYEDSGIPF